MWNISTKKKLIRDELLLVPAIKIDLPTEPIDTKIDLSTKFTSIKSQGRTSSCVAFAVIGTIEYIMNRGGVLKNDDCLSERFLYYKSLKHDETIYDKHYEGTHISSALYIASHYGICVEEMFPYYQNIYENIYSKVDELIAPSCEANIDALKYRISIYGSIDELKGTKTSINDKILLIRKSLSLDLPVIVTYKNSNNPFHMLYAQITGYITDPKLGESSRHCVVIVGYDDDKKLFKFRNSWDNYLFYWGDKGYGYINYADVNIITQGWIVAGIKVCENQDQIQILRSQFAYESHE